MKAIRFTKNWNGKLANRVFTTIRKSKSLEEDYYGSKIGTVFNVVHNDTVLFNARLVSALLYQYARIPDELKAVDTGRTDKKDWYAIFESFYGKFDDTDLFYVLVFEKVAKEVDKETGVTYPDYKVRK
ncbi:MAG: hypothetical protein PHS46_08280 [Candidatus Omnitrophica bacterium]|nr:hypothetical protein [Candidatus Omnitrophota bacterium]